MRLKIKEAILHAKDQSGVKIMYKDIAVILWPDSKELTRKQNMANLVLGKTERVKPEWVLAICDLTGTTPDFLFGR